MFFSGSHLAAPPKPPRFIGNEELLDNQGDFLRTLHEEQMTTV